MTEPNQTPSPEHSVDGLLTFYEKANVALRFALLVVLLWPLAALAAAMLLHGSTAQTVVPIIDMLPLASVLFVILGAPFGLVLLLRHPLARKGFFFLMGLIGIELVIGAYLSIIPISSDNGLVPMLLLLALALLFLWIAKFARALQVLLAVGLVVITIIFIAGGRPTFSTTVKSAFVQVTRRDYSSQNIGSFTVPVGSDSWTQEITLPKLWNVSGFSLIVNRNFDDTSPDAPWFAFRCSGFTGELIDTGKTYKTGEPFPNFYSTCRGPIQFRGHADLLFERAPDTQTARSFEPHSASTDSSPEKPAAIKPESITHPDTSSTSAESRPVTSDTPNAAPTPQHKPLPPDWSAAQQMARTDFIAIVAPCILRAANLHCFYRITNEGNEFRLWLAVSGGTRILDDAGTEYRPSKIFFGSNINTQSPDILLPSGVAVAGSVIFPNFTGSRVQLLDLVFNDASNNTTKFSFRNLSTQRDDQ